MSAERPSTAAWFGGLVASAAPLTLVLRLREGAFDAPGLAFAWGALGVALVVGALWLRRRSDPSRTSLIAGVAAGLVLAVVLAQRSPTAWFMRDVAWHCAKVAVAASGDPLHDPVLRIPTIYPFLFSALVSLPVMLGASVRAAMWAVTPVSLGFGLWAYWWMAAAFVGVRRAAWTQVALPLVFYYPLAGYALLPSPFNLSVGFVFAGLGALARGTQRGSRGRLAAAGALLGTAGLLWYAHLLWITAMAVVWGIGRWKSLRALAIGAALPACVLLLHVVLLASAGNLGPSAITGGVPPEPTGTRLAAMLRNLMTLSGGTSLEKVPAWIGPLVVLGLAVAFLRRPRASERLDGTRVLASAVLPLVLCLVWAGLKLTFWDSFSWRYLFLLDALCLVWIAGARPWHVAGRELAPIAAFALASVIFVPRWILPRIDTSILFATRYDDEVRPVVDLLAARTAFDEPIFASIETWEQTSALGAPRPTLVDRYGGSYKYAPKSAVAERWRDANALKALTDAAAVAELLQPYGFRYAVISQRDRTHPGYEALASGFEVVLEHGPYVVVDLAAPR